MPRAIVTGPGLALVSAATFGTSGSFATALLAAGWTSGGAVIARIGIAALLLTVPAVAQLRGRWPELWRSLPTVAAYGLLAVGGAQLFFFNAVQHLSVGVALLLEYSGTVLVVVWMWLRHGQRPSRLTALGGGLAVLGLLLVLDVLGSARIDGVGVLWGVAAAVGLAVFFVLSGRSDSSLPPLVMAWAGMVLGVAALALLAVLGAIPFRVTTADPHLGGHTTSWLVPVLGLAVVAAAVAYVAGIAAARHLGARSASFFGLAEVLFAILFAWLLLGQTPSAAQLVGGVVVVAGIVCVRLGESVPVPVPASPAISPAVSPAVPAVP